jgi:protease-4
VQVKNIVLHWNSPGGMAAGARETGEWLRRHSAAGGAKPVYSYSDALLASAAYAVAAGSDKIWASESAEVGSIGVILAIADMRRMYEQFGVQMEIFASSELKWTGFPGTSLTPGQREDLQRTVSEFAMVFYEWIAVSRPNAQVEVLDGATFTGRRGRELGLVDELAPDVGELVKHLS